MENNMNVIEKWWRSLGQYDREIAVKVSWEGYNSGHANKCRDEWYDDLWSSLADDEKKSMYDDFFSEC